MSGYITCAVSRTPIMNDDPVALFIIDNRLKNFGKENLSENIDELYYPIAPAIYGNYCQFRSITEITSSLSYENFDKLIKRIYKSKHGIAMIQNIRKQGLKNAPDKKEIPAYTNYQSMIESIMQNELADISYIMIHRDIYYQMIELAGKHSHFLAPDHDLHYLYTKYINGYIQANKKYEHIEDDHQRYIQVRDILRDNENRFMNHTHYGLEFFDNHTLYKNNDWLKNDVVDLFLIKHQFQHSRIPWMPQSPYASMIVNYDVAVLAGEFAKQKRKEYEEMLNQK